MMNKTFILVDILFAASAALAAPLATEGFVTNKIAAAVAAIPAPDYSTTNAALRATIEALAPAPGDYAAVSNAAMNAAAASKYISCDWLYADSHLLTRREPSSPEVVAEWIHDHKPRWGGETLQYRGGGVWRFATSAMPAPIEVEASENGDVLVFPSSDFGDMTLVRTNGVQTVVVYSDDLAAAAAAATNYTDAAMAEAVNQSVDYTDYKIDVLNGELAQKATPAVVTNIVRELSLGGIWDAELEVWWTPVMSGGSLTYQATTNVNLNAEGQP